MKGKTFSGTYGGYKIYEIIEGKGSKGMFPLSKDDKGLSE